jgi:hypothetical protein
MGMFSGITRAFKSIIKGVGKVFKAVGKAVGGIVKSKIGKILLIGAAIWLGGAAAGLWKTGFASIDGALVTATQAASPAAAAAAAPAAGSPFTAASVASTAANTATGGLSAAAPAAVASPFTAAAPAASTAAPVAGVGAGGVAAAAPVNYAGAAEALTAAPKVGLMSKAGAVAKGAAGWIARPENQIPALIGGNMLMSAFTPDQLDVMERERQLQQEDLARANANISGVAGIPALQNTGKSPYAELPNFLTYPPAQRTGFMGRRA